MLKELNIFSDKYDTLIKIIKAWAKNNKPKIKNWVFTSIVFENKNAGKKAIKNNMTFGFIRFIINPFRYGELRLKFNLEEYILGNKLNSCEISNRR